MFKKMSRLIYIAIRAIMASARGQQAKEPLEQLKHAPPPPAKPLTPPNGYCCPA